MRTVEEHLAAVLAGVTPLDDFRQPLLDALDLACAEDVVADVALPRFDNSSMDGYAVVQADVVTASDEAPVRLPVVGEIGAGMGADAVTRLDPGTCAKIMTGAPLPEGADAVVPYEWTDRGAPEVWITRSPATGQHVRYAGEDVDHGDLLVEAGTRLGPRHVGLLASVGRAGVRVRPRPRVAVLSTGSELREAGTPLDDDADRDAIYDGNSWLLAAAVRRAGGIPLRVGLVPDRPDAFLRVLREQRGRADAVITSGGISMGDWDVVKEALSGGAGDDHDVWFGGVAMQPGKPQGFGHLLHGGTEDRPPRRVPFFALPGNPVSSYVSFELFVRPALRRMMGLAPESHVPVTARLTHRVTSPPGRRQFLRGALTVATDGSGAQVEPVGGPGSHLLGDLASSDALIVVPEDATVLEAGADVTVLRLDQD
ncbi:MAG: molybdopterin molybdenumtransferase MoeA [Nocardioides sp.]|nr:molybdopterin molybdenumtransferase MoeA [Nocardioides sp.]